jgi:Uma2 family endonuclease
VLSPSTAAYDRGAKFSHFRQLVSLQEYVLIDMDARTADVFRLGENGLWVLHPFAKAAEVTLASVDLAISAAQLFAEVDSD